MNHSHISIPSPRLLLVEDDPRLREDLDAHFRRRGFRVTVCGDGSHGLEAAGREAFDLVLLDIMLPGLDGLALLESLRREQATPVMLMSALGAEQDRISGFTRAPTTTCRSRSAWPSWMPAPTPCCAAYDWTAYRRRSGGIPGWCSTTRPRMCSTRAFRRG